MVKPFLPPRPSQWDAIRATDEHVLVVAGAGTGKTHTVVGRILWLLGIAMHGERHARPVRLADIAAITFTNEAARELKEALRLALLASDRIEESRDVDLARIGTIHSFCGDVLRENALRAGLPPALAVLEEGEALELATQVARDTLVDALASRSIAGLDTLLGTWRTGDIDRWMVDLMRRPDRVRQLDHVLHEDRVIDPARADATPDPERALVRLTRLALDRLDAALAREARIDFDHIIHWTRDLLQHEEGVRLALQSRIHTLIIDEFQDVDPVQKQIAWLLAGLDENRRDATRLMLVGDPKQSIYRFRGADVSVWTQVERAFRAGRGRVMPLIENFRSLPPILAMVEATVGRVLDTPVAAGAHQAFEVRFRAVEPERTSSPETQAVEFLLVPAAEDGRANKIDVVRDMEADAIAGRIRELAAPDNAWDRFAILLATWSSVRKYEEALARAGIPYYTLRRDGFLDAREVHDLVLALEVLRDPADARALFGFLRSPFVGVRDETLLGITQQARRPFWRHLHEVDAETALLARAAEQLDRWVALRDRMNVADLLREMMEETGFLAHLQLLGDDGLQPLANVRQFLHMIRSMADSSVGDMVRVLHERRARGDRVPEAVLHGRSDPVVTITSIHVAKGLEWPVVFWADLGGRSQTFNDRLVVTDHDIRLGEPDTKPDDQPDPVWKEIRRQLMNEEEAERKRLWYVAATRARDRLVLSGIPQGQGNPARDSMVARLFDFFPALRSAAPGDRIPYHGIDANGEARPITYHATVLVADPVGTRDLREILVPAGEFETGRPGDADPLPIGAPADIERPRPPHHSPAGPLRHSATAFLAHARCPRRHWFKYVVGIREPALDAQARDELVGAIERGQIVHDVLERYREEDELDELLEDAIGRWDENAPAPDSARGRRYREHLREEVTSVVEHPEYSALADRPGARHELPFLYLHPDGSAAQGSIDLAAPGNAADLELLDVKTTQCEAAAAPARAAQYGPQRDVYVTAAGAIAGRPVSRFAFQFTRAAVQVSADIDAAERTAALERYEERSAQIGTDAPPLTRFPQECRFCGYRRVRLCPGARLGERAVAAALERLATDRFRARFRLRDEERGLLGRHSSEELRAHALGFIERRLSPARPQRDGRQTPWRGHPVFVAQHATATCCRGCLERTHGISAGRPLDDAERDYAVDLIMRWLHDQTAGKVGTDGEQHATDSSGAAPRPDATITEPDGGRSRQPADPQLRLL